MDTHQTTIFIAVLISCLALAMIFFFFTAFIIRQQKRNNELHRQNVFAEITAMENERTRIAKDLHDDMGPFLSYIKFQVNSVDSANEQDSVQLGEACSRLDEAVQKLREIAADMMPTALLRKGLETALEELCNKTNRYTSLHMQLQFTASTLPDQQTAINIYRMIQEVLQNTLKHAGAHDFLIQVSEKENQWIIICEDNGKGFDYHKMLRHSKGLGLRNIKSRAELINGKMHVQSYAAKGTQYIFELPIQS